MYKIHIVFTNGNSGYFDRIRYRDIVTCVCSGEKFPTYGSALAFAKYLRRNYNEVVYTEIVLA